MKKMKILEKKTKQNSKIKKTQVVKSNVKKYKKESEKELAKIEKVKVKPRSSTKVLTLEDENGIKRKIHKIVIREAFNNIPYENLAEVKDINGNLIKIKKTTKIIKEFQIDQDSDTEVNELTENLQQEIQHTLNEREERATPETNTNQQHTLENEEKEEIISHKPKPKQKNPTTKCRRKKSEDNI